MQAIAELLGVCQRTLRRWRIHISGKGFNVDQRKGAQRNVAHKLSIQERQNIINVINEMRFAHLPPAQVVAILAEEGNYIGSEMTIYRIMREEGLLNHRGRARQMRKKREVPMLEARGIKQVLAWDITLLPSPIIGRYYYLYMVMDVWSRRILGVEVHGEQCGKLAGEFFDRICRDEKINKESAAVLYSDNGAH